MHLTLSRWGKRGMAVVAVAAAAALFAPAFVSAQSRSEAQLALQVQELQDLVRNLNGRIEGLEFNVTQLQTQLERITEDYEFRFQQLEGGGLGKTEAAPQSGGEMPAGEAPQPVTGTDALPPLTAEPAPAGPPPLVSPDDELGDSADPLLGSGQPGGAVTGVLGSENTIPLDLSFDGGQAIVDGDADAQFAAGSDAIQRGNFAFAEEQFRQFIALYPSDPRAPDAVNWLGEALLQRGAYDDAATVLVSGFEKYQNSARAPDILLRLGVAFVGADNADAGCRAFFEIGKRFPNQPPAFQQRLQQERQKANCPV